MAITKLTSLINAQKEMSPTLQFLMTPPTGQSNQMPTSLVTRNKSQLSLETQIDKLDYNNNIFSVMIYSNLHEIKTLSEKHLDLILLCQMETSRGRHLLTCRKCQI